MLFDQSVNFNDYLLVAEDVSLKWPSTGAFTKAMWFKRRGTSSTTHHLLIQQERTHLGIDKNPTSCTSANEIYSNVAGSVVCSGATAGLIPAIRELGVPVLEEQNAPTMFRISSRKAPHNLYADTELVREKINDRGFYFLQPGPNPLYPFGLDQNNWSEGASKVTIKYSDFTTVIWKQDGDKYARFIIDNYSDNKEAVAHNFITQEGNSDILKTETIVVLQGPLYKDKATTLPSVLTVGVGDAYVISDGKHIKGTWRRGDISETFVLLDSNQNPIEVPPSSQWVHILPNEGEITIED